MNIEDFNVSEECLGELKRVGFTTVEEILDFLYQQSREKLWLRGGWYECFEEIVDQLKAISLWSGELEQAWPSN